MSYASVILLLFLALLVGVPVMLEIGRKAGIRGLAYDPEGAKAGLAPIESAIFGLVALLLAFTFSGASSRLDIRRHLIVDETNAIATAYRRIDLLPPASQPFLRDKFRRYVDLRIAVYEKLPDIDAAKAELARSTELQGEIWTEAIAASKETNSAPLITLMLGSLNQMIEVTTSRTVILQTHPPQVIYLMLGLLSLVASLLVGYGMAGSKKRSWMHILAYLFSLTLTVYVILELEFPQIGFIRMNTMDFVLTEFRTSMK